MAVEQKVAYFSKDVDLPITLGLLIDTSGSMDRVLPAEQDAASRFLRQVMRPKDLTMVINFDLDANLIADFTQDVSVLERAIRSTVMNAPRCWNRWNCPHDSRIARRNSSLRCDLPGLPRRTMPQKRGAKP